MAREIGHRLDRRLSGWPLRTKLVVLLMGLVAAALFIAGLAAAAALRGYLYTQVDRNLTAQATEIANPMVPAGPEQARLPAPARPRPLGSELTYVRVSDPSGAQVRTSAGPIALADPPVLPELTVDDVAGLSGDPFVVDSESGATRWRVVELNLADGSGSVAVAQDIGGIDSAVSRLMVIEVMIGAVVLILLGVVGRILIRRSLRPLVGVEQAAAAIAAGDLAKRAPESDPRTEVGSLARSFNTMVDEVQDAFAAQQASESDARRSAELARASEARMRQFIADASHELRTPLTSVRGFAELYRLGAVGPGEHLDDAMGRIEAEAARMGVLVDDLLLLARLDQQRPLDVGIVELSELAADSVVAARVAAPGRELCVEVASQSDGGVLVCGDAVRLRQVVDNLLSNAIRYSGPDQPVVVRVGRVGGQGAGGPGWAMIEVADRGPGMDPQVAARVFERFFRADPARSREQGGSGLGLAIVAAIVSAHSGRVELDTAQGAGATFRVLLPLAGQDCGSAAGPDADPGADLGADRAAEPAPYLGADRAAAPVQS